MSTSIEWTDETWNPTTGCTKVSPGCAHCYIERTPAFRIAGRKFVAGATDLRLHADRLKQPLRWRKPRRVFVNSLSDLFHPDVPDVFIERVFSVMALAERHTFQILTKRPERMRGWFKARRFDVKGYAILQTENGGECHYAHPWPLPNVWLGVSVENRRMRDERVPHLLKTPAAVKFISAEPLLEDIADDELFTAYCVSGWTLPPYDDKVDWVIIGGESGPGARPFDIAWARSIITACQQYDTPVFVKQLGAMPIAGRMPHPNDMFLRLRDRKGGDPAEWPADLRVRQFPEARA